MKTTLEDLKTRRAVRSFNDEPVTREELDAAETRWLELSERA